MTETPTTPESQSLGRILKRTGRALKIGCRLTSLAIGLVAAGRWVGFVAFALPLLAALVHAVRTLLRLMDEAALARRLETATGRTDNALVISLPADLRNVVLLDSDKKELALDGVWRGAGRSLQTLAEVIDLRFRRIQFTPDLMPTDITGTDVLEVAEASGRKNYLIRASQSLDPPE